MTHFSSQYYKVHLHFICVLLPLTNSHGSRWLQLSEPIILNLAGHL